MNQKRLTTVLLMLALVVISAAASWLAGSRIQSPAEAAARTAPPSPAPILVPIEERVLSADIVTRGTARFGLPQAVSLVPSTLKSAAGLITTLPEQGSQLDEGALLLTVSGRPVFVLRGEIPVYRDLVPGISGPDVRQLEDALERLGFDPGPNDGVYDEQTGAAVEAWYTSAGWRPFGPPAGQLATIRSLEQALAEALNRKSMAEAAAAAAPLMVEAARATAAANNKTAAAAVAAGISARDQVSADAAATAADRASAEAQLEAAQAMALATQLAGEVAVQAAIDARLAADREARLSDDLATQIAADLDVAQRQVGPQVPADEIVFLVDLPARVDRVEAAVGDPAGGPVMMVTNNQLAIDSSLPLDEAPLVKPGMAVAIDEPDLGIKATGVVARVAGIPGSDGVDGFHLYFETLVDETPLEIEGVSLRLTIPVQSTGGLVTVVPVSALSLSADGTSRVQVEHDGLFETIRVEPGLTAAGFVEVTPIEGELAPGQLVVIGYE